MKLKGELQQDELESIVRAYLVERFGQFSRLTYLYIPYVSGTRFEVDDEDEKPAAPVEEAS